MYGRGSGDDTAVDGGRQVYNGTTGSSPQHFTSYLNRRARARLIFLNEHVVPELYHHSGAAGGSTDRHFGVCQG